MRRVRRVHTVAKPNLRSTDFPDVDRDMRTLHQRMLALKPGDSLYPWAKTKLTIRNGRREWVAK